LKNANRRYYRIANVIVRVESDLPITDGTFMPRFKLFETDGPGDDTITIRHHSIDPPMTPREFGRRVYRQPPWAVYDNGRSWIYVAIDDDDVPLKGGQVAVFSRDYSDGDIYTPDPRIFRRGDIQSITLMPSDQVLLAQVFAARRACYLHSSGVILNGKGLLFAGHSDAGKSTMVKMLKGRAEILCDDRVVIRKGIYGFRIHGTWSHGEVPDVSPSSAPLRGIFVLIKSEENACLPMEDKKVVVKNLLEFLIKPYANPRWWESTLSLIGEIAAEVPCHTLLFDRSGKVVDLLESMTADV